MRGFAHCAVNPTRQGGNASLSQCSVLSFMILSADRDHLQFITQPLVASLNVMKILLIVLFQRVLLQVSRLGIGVYVASDGRISL